MTAALALLFASAVALAGLGGSPLAQNAVLAAGLLLVLLARRFRRGGPEARRARAGFATPWPRALDRWIPAAVAVLAAARTLRLPYLSDDWVHLNLLGDVASPIDVVAGSHGVTFWRPVPWLLWWGLAHVSPLDATLAHALAVALFALLASTLVLALRRFGARRGTAVVAATAFAASPIALDVAAWASNFYAITSALFLTAAIACLPARPNRAGAVAAASTLALLAALCREDAILAPIVLLAAATRLRRRGAARWCIALAPLAVAIAGVVALRLLVFGGLVGYAAFARAQGSLATRGLESVWAGLTQETLASWILPWRGGGAWLAVVPPGLLLLGGASRAGSRELARGLALAALVLAPEVLALPFRADGTGARFLFLPWTGIAWIVASRLGAAPGGARGRAAAAGAWLALSLAAGHHNLGAWERSARAFAERAQPIARLVASAPHGARVLVYGQPDSIDGALCFRNATAYAFPLLAARRDVTVLPTLAGFLASDRIVCFDDATGEARDETAPPVRAWTGAAPLRFDLTRAGPDRAACRVADLRRSDGPGGAWHLSVPSSELGSLLLPAVAWPGGRTLVISAEAAARDEKGAAFPPLFVLLHPSPAGIERAPVALGAPIDLGSPPPAWVRVELPIPPDSTYELRSVTLEARAN